MKKIIFILFVLSVLAELVYSQVWVQKLTGTSFWAITKDYQGNIYAGGTSKSIYKSTDNGDNWTLLFTGTSNILYMSCDSVGNILASYGSEGVLKSTNGGLNWSVIPGSTFGSNVVNAVAFGKPGFIYVGTTSGGIYRSTDGGLTFPDNALSGASIVSIYVDKYDKNRIFAGASSASATNGIFLSTNAGTNWSDNLTPGTNSWAIAQKSATEFYSAGTSTGYAFLKSTNGGLNWQTIYNFTSAKRGLTVDLIGNLYCSGNSGTFKSTNNGTSFFNFNFTVSANQCLTNGNRLLVTASGSSNGGIWIYTDTTLTGIIKLSGEAAESYELEQNFPNPFNSTTYIKFNIPVCSSCGGKNPFVIIKVYDISGKELKTLVKDYKQPGTYQISFNAKEFSSGVYFYRMEAGDFSETKKFVLTK